MTQDRVMLLIDADNVSIDIMEQAVQLLHKQHGGVHVRRAYCTAESAVKHQAAFKRLGIKPMVNLAAGKNSTDIALAVDAIDLVLAERPEVVVIASSDSDFAPLVQRLREKGCEVRGIGQAGKTGQETQEVYDDFTVLEHRKPTEAPAAKRSAPRKAVAASKTAVAGKAPASTPPPKPASTPSARKTPAAKKGAARKSAASTAATGVVDKADEAGKAKPRRPDQALEAQVAAAFADVLADDAAAAEPNPEAAPTPAPMPAKPARKRAARKSVDERVAASAAATQRQQDTEDTPAASAEAPAGAAAPTDAPAAAPAPAPAPAPATTPASAPAPTSADTPTPRAGSGRASIDAVLRCLPELQTGQSLALNTAVRRLRDAQLLGQNSSSLRLFSSWPERFELVPANRPSVVRLRG